MAASRATFAGTRVAGAWECGVAGSGTIPGDALWSHSAGDSPPRWDIEAQRAEDAEPGGERGRCTMFPWGNLSCHHHRFSFDDLGASGAHVVLHL